MAFFDFGDELDAPLNIQKEVDRFVIIDKQLYGLYSVFGNGVLNGWTVSDNGFSESKGISVAVSPGQGIIRAIASETRFSGVVNNLPALSQVDIYAILQGSTVRNRTITFDYSQTELGDYAVRIARVTTGNNAVTTINNNIRDLIGFEEIIRDEIDQHKHRGTPSKIDLKRETKGQLPGAKVEGIDASKLTSGIIPISQIPIIPHQDLQYDGLLTHAQLDSFTKTLSENNKELLGEIATANQLKQIIFNKYRYSDVDEHFLNELALIPGISPDTFIDFEASTAHINLDQKCISGISTSTGEFVDISFNTRTAFANAFKLTNVEVLPSGKVVLERDEQARDIIKDFENVPDDNVNIPGFTLSTEVITDNFSIKSEATDTLKVDGFYSGKFNPNREFRAVFTKAFSTARDWEDFDELIVNVKTLSVSHGAVFAYFVNESSTGSETVSPNLLLLANDEITDNPDTSRNDFEKRTFDISGYDRDNVTKFIIFTDDVSDSFDFYLDEMYVQNASLFKPQGTIKLRYSTGAPLTFHSLFYDIDTPATTDSQVRIKVAGSTSLLSRAPYSLGLNDGQVFALGGTDIEIEVTLTSEDRIVSPELTDVSLRLLVDSDTHGFNIDTGSDWSRGNTQNLDITNYSGSLSRLNLSDPINVGGLYFSTLDAIAEIDDENVGIIGFSGINMPISVNQAFSWDTAPLRGFDNPTSVERTLEKNFIVADTDNDRVLLVDSRGDLVKGFAGIPGTDSEFYPATSVYNPENGILTIVFSREVNKEAIALPGISLFIGSTEIKLGVNDTIVDNSKTDQILEIELSGDKVEQLVGQTTDLHVNFASTAFAETISSGSVAGSLLGLQGVEVFIGDLTYVNYILSPIYANVLEDGNWIVANGENETEVVNSTDAASSSSDVNAAANARTIPSLVEFDEDDLEDPSLTYSGIQFSIYSLGGVAELPLNRLALAGIVALEESSTGTVTSSTDETPDNQEDTILYTLEYDNFVTNASGDQELTSASSVVLEDESGEYGIKEAGTGTVIAVSGSQMILLPRRSGRYFYSFEAAPGKTFTAAIKVVQNEGDDPVFESPRTITDTGSSSAFAAAATENLSGFRGTVVTINRTTKQKLFEYTSPDGLFASDVDVHSDGNLVVAETDFTGNNGRVIKLDTFGNIIFQYGQGNLGIIKDAKSLDNGNYVISL